MLNYAALVVFAVAAAWWLLRDRAIRAGRADLADETIARDFVFALVLLFVVTSRVLSPQFMIWLLGLAAVVLCARDSRLRRPAWVVVAAVIFSATRVRQPRQHAAAEPGAAGGNLGRLRHPFSVVGPRAGV